MMMMMIASKNCVNLLFCLVLFLFPTCGISSSLRVPAADDMVPLKKTMRMRSIMEEENKGHFGNNNKSSMVLAGERTRRKDIFNHFQPYTAGWNISNPLYISSVLSTAVPFFAVAIGWFTIFGIFLFIFCMCSCCCNHEQPEEYSKSIYAYSITLLIFCAIAAIAGCVILYTGQGRLHGSTSKTLNYVVNQADFTAQNLRNVSSYFDSAKKVVVGVNLSPDFEKTIDNVQSKITNAAAILSNQTKHNSNILHHVIDGMILSLIIVAAVMLSVAFLGFLSSILGFPALVYFLVVIGWILVAGTLILSGAFMFLHNAIGDTCVAMDEWVLNPTAHTALDKILPCVESATALETRKASKVVTHTLVESVDEFIFSVTSGYKVHYNQSGPFMPLLCNPFNDDFTDRKCEPGEVSLDNAAEVWKNYTCEAPLGNCITQGRMTPSMYTQMVAAVNVTYGLYQYGPFLVDLVNCKFVRDTIEDISRIYCPASMLYTEWISFGSLVVSVAVMLSLLFWIILVREQCIKQSMDT